MTWQHGDVSRFGEAGNEHLRLRPYSLHSSLLLSPSLTTTVSSPKKFPNIDRHQPSWLRRRPPPQSPPIRRSSTYRSTPPPHATPNSIYASSSPSLRRIAIAVDLSDESAFAVKWAAENYIRPGDTVILLHVRSTSVLYGADWGSSTPTNTGASNPFTKTAAATPAAVASPRQMEEEYDSLTAKKANNLAQPLVEAHVPVKIHIVKDHDMKERLCLEVERLGLSAVIMGSRGIGASRGRSKGKLGSVSDYCVQHCACPVVVVRYKQEEKAAEEREDEDNYQDADDQLK